MLLEVVVIYIGAGFLTEYGPKLAECLGVPDSLISLTWWRWEPRCRRLVATLLAAGEKRACLPLPGKYHRSQSAEPDAGRRPVGADPADILGKAGALRLELPLLSGDDGDSLRTRHCREKDGGGCRGAALAALYMGYLWTVL